MSRFLFLVATAFLVTSTSHSATIVGPTPDPTGGTVTLLSSGDAGASGGATLAYSDFLQTTGWQALYYGVASDALPAAGLSGTTSALTFVSAIGQVATWQGTTTWTDPNDSTTYNDVPTQFLMTITGLGSDPWILSTSVPGLDPGPGSGTSVVIHNTDGFDFTANVQFLADIPTDASGFIPINTVPQGPPGGQTVTTWGIGFYTVIPEPSSASLLLLASGGLLLRRRR